MDIREKVKVDFFYAGSSGVSCKEGGQRGKPKGEAKGGGQMGKPKAEAKGGGQRRRPKAEAKGGANKSPMLPCSGTTEKCSNILK